MKLGDNMTMEACNMWGDVCPRKCRPPRIGDIPKHGAVDEESPGSSANKLTISPADPADTVLDIPAESNRNVAFSLGTPKSPGVFHAVPRYEALNDLPVIGREQYASGQPFHKVHERFQQECHSVSQQTKDARGKAYYITSDILEKPPTPPRLLSERKLGADVQERSVNPSNRLPKLSATSTDEQQESPRIPSSPDEVPSSDILEVRKDSALFLEEAEGLPTLREIFKTRAPRIIRPRRESSGYASNLGTFDEERRNSSTADVLQDLSSFLKERRRSSTKRLNSRIALGRAEDSLGEETNVGQASVSERMPTTEINRKISSAGLEMPNIEEVKELQRDEASSRQESLHDLCTLVGRTNIDELPARCHLLGQQPSNHKPTPDLTKPTIPVTAEFLVSKDAFSVASVQETVVHRASTQDTRGSAISSGQIPQPHGVDEERATRTLEGQYQCQRTKDEVDRSARTKQAHDQQRGRLSARPSPSAGNVRKILEESSTLHYRESWQHVNEQEEDRRTTSCREDLQQHSRPSTVMDVNTEKVRGLSQGNVYTSRQRQRPSEEQHVKLDEADRLTNTSKCAANQDVENGGSTSRASARDYKSDQVERPSISNVSASYAEKHQRESEHASTDHETDNVRSSRILDEGSTRLTDRQGLKQAPLRDASVTTILGRHDEPMKVFPRSVKMYQLLSTQSEDRGDGERQLSDRRISLQIPRQDDDSAPIVSSSGKSMLGVTSSRCGPSESDISSGRLGEPNSAMSASSLMVRKLSSPGEVGAGQRHLGDGTNVSVRPIYPYCPYSPYGSPQGSPRNRRRPLRESRRVSIDNKQGALQLNQYKLLDNIGQGSYGIVKLAYNEEDETHYAMKILSKKKLMKKAGIFGRMAPGRKGVANPLAKVYREIALLKKLDHPNVVKLVEVLDDPDEDNLYLVFELVQKGEVLQIPTDKPLDEETARKNFRDVVMGIEYLHYQRIVHRDIKPSNLLVDSEGRIKIADLGVSAELRASGELLSGPAGTPAFAAPETTTPGAHYSGTLCDVWSMGVTLYSFVTGRVPWDGAGSIIGVQAAVRSEALKFPDKPALSDDLQDIISRMLAKEPSERVALRDLKEHSWLTNGGKEPLPSDADNCRLPVTVTDEEVERVVTRVPKLDTLILIKTMLKQHSFQNPFLSKRVGRTNCTDADASALELSPSGRTAEDSTHRDTIRNVKTDRFHRAGRSNSAPDSYNWQTNGRQISVESPLPPVTEASSQESEVEKR